MKSRIILSIFIVFILITNHALSQEGRIVRETVYSPSLEGNLLGDSPNRPVTIYLPPSYDTNPEMVYPVVYLLHGYTGNNELWTGGSYISASNIVNSMKSWLNSGKVKEMILVMPNSYNKLLGSFYTNSIATGKWADYIAKDLVSYIDKKYRTLPQPESRGIIGHSMGGYGGMKLGILYPDVFSCMGGMAGVYIADDTLERINYIFAIASNIQSWQQFYSMNWQNQIAYAWSAACVPNTERPPFFCDYPFIYDNDGNMIKVQEVYNRFMEHSILNMAEKYREILLNMRAIYLDCGTNDYLLVQPIVETRKLHAKLEELRIKHVYKEFTGDHTCCVMYSTGDALEVFSKAMAYEMLVNVKPLSKLATTWGQIRREQ